MFGKNPKPSFTPADTGDRVLVHSLFNTIQGEGPYTGRPAIFIRLGGCPLHCWFCDTDFAEESSSWFKPDELAWMCASNWDNAGWRAEPLVVITGGEPLYQNLTPLVTTLREGGFVVQVETSGAVKDVLLPGHKTEIGTIGIDLVVSPKTPTVNKRVHQYAIAWKYIVGHDTEISENGIPIDDTQKTGTPRELASPSDRFLIWLQPREDYLPNGDSNHLANEANRERVKELALQFGYNVSLQTHKILGVA